MKEKGAGLARARKFPANGSGDGKCASGHSSGETELGAAIQRYVDLFDFAPISYVSFDRVGRIEEINVAAARLLGRSRARLVGNPFALCVANADTKLFLHHLLSCRASENQVDSKIRLRRANGRIVHVVLSSTPTYSPLKHGARLYQTAIFDITHQKRAEQALRESEERYRAIVSQSVAGMARTDLKGQLTFANGKFCEVLGYEESELVGKTILEITHPDDVAESRRLFQRMVRKGEPYQLEKRYLRKDGTAFWVSVSASPTRDANGNTQAAVAIILDITEQRKARALLEERARGLEGEILEISDREQRRLGQDLHDSLCQHLTAVAFMARSVAMRLKNHRVLEVEDIEKIAELINEGVTEARTIARGLHPVEMDSAGLSMALRSLQNQKSTPSVRLEIDEIGVSDPTVAQHLYRIAREAVMNANRHARAREIIVRLHRRRKGIELSVTDDGVGIGANSGDGIGMGLHIMEYRARSTGAELEIKPVRPHGTCVTCYLPLK